MDSVMYYVINRKNIRLQKKFYAVGKILLNRVNYWLIKIAKDNNKERIRK